MNHVESWGRLSEADQELVRPQWRTDPLPATDKSSMLAFGRGRSYGDSCLNEGQVLIETARLNRFIEFDRDNGTLTCEAGCTFDEILSLIVPFGWFLPVTPGTKFISVGGAIANDVHGKNHHVAGNFGHHVLAFELLRSDGERLLCSPTRNPEMFRATIGGLGLTGLIVWAKFSLHKIKGSFIAQETIRFGSLAEFFKLSAEFESTHAYSVSWIDCLAQGKWLGRGHFIAGNTDADSRDLKVHVPGKLAVPRFFPPGVLNSLTVRAFNFAYYWRQIRAHKKATVHYDPFFYPLDKLRAWNRMYGPHGFYQYQCVLPYADGAEQIKDLLRVIAKARAGSFLAVLKTFGSKPSLGMMSFPRPGVTLALDFPNNGVSTEKLFRELDSIVRAAPGGAIYIAKDARMDASMFRSGYPRWKEFSKFIDPNFSSSFWRRVTDG